MKSNIFNFVNRLVNAYKQKGLIKTLKLIFFRCGIYICAVPIALALFLISPFIPIRFIKLYSGRIGQYGGNTHLLLCALESGDFKDKYKNVFYASPGSPICNQQFHKMWKRVIPILPFSILCFYIDKFLSLLQGKKYDSFFKRYFESSEGDYDKWRYHVRSKKCYLSFLASEQKLGQKMALELGIPIGAKYVCLLVRDPAYLQKIMPHTEDWKYHMYRDADINNYKDAINYLIGQGYYVIRMGKHVAGKLEVFHPQVIDYANHSLQSDFMDIYLSAHCSFFISTSTGIDVIPRIFNIPLIVTNAILFDMRSYNFNVNVFTIPKKVMDRKQNKLLTIKEVLDACGVFIDTRVCPGLDRNGLFKDWQKKNYNLVENNSQEILDVVIEMVQFVEQKWYESMENRLLQEKFWNVFPSLYKDETSKYSHIKSRIGYKFLESNQYLLK